MNLRGLQPDWELLWREDSQKTPATVCLHLSGSHLYYTCLALKRQPAEDFGACHFYNRPWVACQTGYWSASIYWWRPLRPVRATSPKSQSRRRAPSARTSYVSGLAGAVFAHFPPADWPNSNGTDSRNTAACESGSRWSPRSRRGAWLSHPPQWRTSHPPHRPCCGAGFLPQSEHPLHPAPKYPE